MHNFAIKDLIDILIVGLLLFYVYKLMHRSGTLTLFYGIFSFILIWFFASVVFDMRLTGLILDKVMSVGFIIIVILFQDQIKRFLIDLGSRSRFTKLKRLFSHEKHAKDSRHAQVMAIVKACMNMSKSKTGALIVVQRKMPLADYEKTGDTINADINSRLIENIFFKNSPLHDGAMIIAGDKIRAAGCILPVSHDMDIPKKFGLRHRAALGMSEVTDALCIVVSEETGNISTAMDSTLSAVVSSQELETTLSSVMEKQSRK